MKSSLWFPASSALMLILGGCANKTDSPVGTGPYDSAGNYHEEWADDPSKWRKPGKAASGDELPTIAKNEQPPPNATPLAAQGSSPKLPPVQGEPKVVASKRKATASADEPKRHVTSTRKSPSSKRKHVDDSDEPKKRSTAKAKSSPSSRYTVKAGDSLWSIAARKGTTVEALKKANGISGTLIRDGRTLVIPKKR